MNLVISEKMSDECSEENKTRTRGTGCGGELCLLFTPIPHNRDKAARLPL